ncbi:Protein of unknown function [Leuconostoc citreum]|nr:Protein of unknown function [Leuconostoc citreum LBAE C10]CCF26250.1 Protein of unknown function [Leuconostoc citreum LBAE C11]CDX64859.1 Protein of unknown function [Leuconostoc citreum]
MLNVTRVG